MGARQQKLRKLLLLFYLFRKRRRQGKIRSCWVRPTNTVQQRNRHSIHLQLNMQQRHLDEKYFTNYFRMNAEHFDLLLSKVRPNLEKTSIREPISASERLGMTLRYLASGDSMISLANNYRVGKSTVSKIIRETSSEIWTCLSNEVFPNICSQHFWKHSESDFKEKWNMPHCLGAIDGKHIVLQAPPNSGSDFFNYKGQHSLVLMAVCDANYKFIYIDLGAQGRQSDGGVFRKTAFYKKLKLNQLNLPPPEILPGIDGNIPFYFVGDEAFPLMENLMRPFPGRFLIEKKTIFNYRLSRARRTIENAFGILSARWRVLRKPIIASLESAEKITLATIALHNWLITKKYGTRFNEVTNGDPNMQYSCHLPRISGSKCNVHSKNAAEIRLKLADYFITNGEISFQWERHNNH